VTTKSDELRLMLDATNELAAAMQAKLVRKRRAGFFGGLDPENRPAVVQKLREHVDELIGECDHCSAVVGDGPAPRQAIDVANLAMMLWVQGGKPR
jgi:hypothetical protein